MKENKAEEPRVVMVYMEQTPNPEALKFVSNLLLLPQGSVEYSNKADAVYCPLAYQLFDFTGVLNVFITSNFVTVTKTPGMDWWEIQNIIREFIRGFLVAGDAVFTKNHFEEKAKPEAGSSKMETNSNKEFQTPSAKQETNLGHTERSRSATLELENQIRQLLDEYVKPAVEQDGGAIDFKSFEDGVVTVLLKGSCSGCPSSTLTLKSGIERLLKQMMPEVTEVVAE